MTLTSTATSRTATPTFEKNLNIQKIPSLSVNPKHFIDLLRNQTALIRQTPLPQGLAYEPCDLSVFGPDIAVTVRKFVPVNSRSSTIVASTQRLVNALQNYLSNSGSAFHLADSICDFCQTVRMSRFTAPSLLQSLIDQEAENGVLLPLTNALKALSQNNHSEAFACVQQLRNSNLYREAVTISMTDIACNKIRRHLHTLQKLISSWKSRSDSDAFQSYIPWSSSSSLLLETTLQIITWLHKFVIQSYIPDEHEDSLMSNLCLLSGSVASAAQDLLLASTADEARMELSCFWVSVKALIDLLASEEQFGDESLQGTHTGRQLVFHHLKRMQSARNKIRECLN